MTHVDLSQASIAAGGSLRLGGYLATPEGPGPFPAVVMIHEAFGLNAQMRRHADLLAANDGFDAASVNYGRLPRDLGTALQGACPVVANYGGKDRTLQGAAARLETALDSLGVEHDVKEFPSAGHSFLTSIAPQRPF